MLNAERERWERRKNGGVQVKESENEENEIERETAPNTIHITYFLSEHSVCIIFFVYFCCSVVSPLSVFFALYSSVIPPTHRHIEISRLYKRQVCWLTGWLTVGPILLALGERYVCERAIKCDGYIHTDTQRRKYDEIWLCFSWQYERRLCQWMWERASKWNERMNERLAQIQRWIKHVQHSQYYDIWTTVTTTMGFCHNGRYDNSTTGSSSSRHIAFSTIYKRICWALPSVITAHKTRRARELERQGKRKKNLLLYLSEILRASVIFHIFLYTHILYTHTCTIT